MPTSIRNPQSALCNLLEPPTRLRTRIERRSTVEVELEIPAGIEAFAIGNSVIINAGKRGFLSASDAIAHGLIKIVETKFV